MKSCNAMKYFRIHFVLVAVVQHTRKTKHDKKIYLLQISKLLEQKYFFAIN